MTTDAKTPREVAEERKYVIECEIGEVEFEIEELKERQDRLNAELDQLCESFPPVPKVQKAFIDGKPWLSDGYRAVRDAWPGEFAFKAVEPGQQDGLNSALAKLIADAAAIEAPVTIVEQGAVAHNGLAVARLSSGAVLRLDWLQELTAVRPSVLHSAKLNGLVAFKDEGGEVWALQMGMYAAESGPQVVYTYPGEREGLEAAVAENRRVLGLPPQ